jgi:hypothetical protein
MEQMATLKTENFNDLLAGIQVDGTVFRATAHQIEEGRTYNRQLSEQIGQEERARQAASVEHASRMYLTI